MHAVGVTEYGPVENLHPADIPRLSKPTGRQLLVQVKAASVNPIDIKVRSGTYDDAPDYYDRVKPLTREAPGIHVMGYDGAGVVQETGPDVKHFQAGDEGFYLGNVVGLGSDDIVKQIRELDLGSVPLKYAFITSRTEQYLHPIAEVLAPFGKVCSIVQAHFDMYGTQFMSKSLTFAWCWLGTGPYHHYENDREEKHHEWYEELARLVDSGTVKCHLRQRLGLTAEGIREAHRIVESGKAVGKIALGVDEAGDGKAFR
ncbi:hypothetical protein F4778DRAFT_800637 [Xylariomycetidae sp. FL2044]|nr:hypothetical protein F4778DRAFT_800637 [Xylariomycetidae sp. FL2044]